MRRRDKTETSHLTARKEWGDGPTIRTKTGFKDHPPLTTVIRRKRASRMQIGPYRRHELLTGRIVYPVQARKQQVVSTYVKNGPNATGVNQGRVA